MPYLCLKQEGNDNLPRFLEKAQLNGYSVIAVPINYFDVPLEFERAPLCENLAQYSYADLLLSGDQWCSKVILMLSDTIDCDSEYFNVRTNSEKTLLRDISWAEHLQYCGYILIELKSGNNTNLARLVTANIKGAVLVQVPLHSAKVAQSTWRRDLEEEDVETFEDEDTWQWWNKFRWAANFNPKIKVVLELDSGRVPSKDEIRRWLGEPIDSVILPADLFIRNRTNHPVLTKAWQDVIKQFLVHSKLNLIVSSGTDDNSLKQYSEYLAAFRETHKSTHQLQNFEDVLEVPLQPLYDNLDCYTYEMFEKDPVKYKLYQVAIEAALIDRVPEEKRKKALTVIMVLGAGRGPLVRSALNAAANTNCRVRVYIIEKNPNAVRTLSSIVRKLWHNKDVHLFSKDMRHFSPPEKADIIVSELLGSFGDNELSPECLDCAQRLLKDDGISIPCKSTSYINPLMSQKLLNAVQNARHDDKKQECKSDMESTYVVLLKNVYHIDVPKPLFEFVHPNRKEPIDNRRFKKLQFKTTLDCVVNGFAGYFDTVLYKNILLSIHPLTHTVGMASWFPMYFSLSEPMELRKDETIEIHFWRCISEQKIWYEWCLTKPRQTQIHNIGGSSSFIYCT